MGFGKTSIALFDLGKKMPPRKGGGEMINLENIYPWNEIIIRSRPMKSKKIRQGISVKLHKNDK